MRQVFGEWGVVTETKSTSYGILSAPVASTIGGISHIVSEPARTDKYNRVIGKRAPSKKGGYTP